MLWKIYFWVITALFLYLIGLIIYSGIDFFEIEYNLLEGAYDSLMWFVTIIVFFGMYGFVYEKLLFTSNFWKFIFLFNVIDTLGEISHMILNKNYTQILVFVPLTPFFYSLLECPQ